MTNLTGTGGGGLKNQSLANLSQNKGSMHNSHLNNASGVRAVNSQPHKREKSQNKERIEALKQRMVNVAQATVDVSNAKQDDQLSRQVVTQPNKVSRTSNSRLEVRDAGASAVTNAQFLAQTEEAAGNPMLSIEERARIVSDELSKQEED